MAHIIKIQTMKYEKMMQIIHKQIHYVTSCNTYCEKKVMIQLWEVLTEKLKKYKK